MPKSCALILLDILCGNSCILGKLGVCRIFREKAQDRAEKPGCIFIFVGGQDILSAPVCVRWRTGRCDDAQAGLNPAVLILFQGKIYGR